MPIQDQQDNAHRVCPRVCLGKITTAHGVRGLVKILVHGEAPYLLEELSPLYTSETGNKTLKITMKSSGGKFWLAAVAGIHDRTEAETLRNTDLWVDRSALPDIADEDEFYITDLVGMAAKTTDGKETGKVIAVKNFGASDMLEIQPKTGDSFYVPFTNDAVPDIDIENKTVVITPDNLD